MTETSLTVDDRLRRMVARGFETNADVRWFVGPHGFLTWCQLLAQHKVEEADDLDMVLTDLDDRLVAAPGPLPSARARALVSLARAVGSGQRPDVDVEVARGLVGDESDVGINMARAGAADVCDFFRTGTETHPSQQISVPIAVSMHSHGEIVQFRAVRRGVEAGSIGPDLLDGPFQRWGSEFLRALEDAAQATRPEAPVRFVVLSGRTGLPIDAVDGRSVGLGAAVAFARLSKRPRPAPDPSWVFTGDVRPDGQVASLAHDRAPGAYADKIAAVQNRTIVMPAVDLPVVDQLLIRSDVPAVGVNTVAEVEQAVERHRLGVAAYSQTFSHLQRQRQIRMLKRVVIGFFAVLVLTLAMLVRSRNADRAVAAIKERVWGEVVTMELAGGLIEIQQNELSNLQYVECIRAAPRVCDRPSTYDPALASPSDPVRGLSAIQSAQLCEWVGGQLPPDEVFREIAAKYAEHEYGGDGAISMQPSDDLSVEAESTNNIVGNLIEWTSTQCEATFANCSGWSTDRLPGQVVGYGVAFEDPDPADSAADADSRRQLADGMAASEQTVNWGMRCMKFI